MKRCWPAERGSQQRGRRDREAWGEEWKKEGHIWRSETHSYNLVGICCYIIPMNKLTLCWAVYVKKSVLGRWVGPFGGIFKSISSRARGTLWEEYQALGTMRRGPSHACPPAFHRTGHSKDNYQQLIFPAPQLFKRRYATLLRLKSKCMNPYHFVFSGFCRLLFPSLNTISWISAAWSDNLRRALCIAPQ